MKSSGGHRIPFMAPSNVGFFYLIKPAIPRALQLFLRRNVARYIRKHSRDVWPIKPDTATPPAGWKGWPDGKRFAFVLNHDVELQKGQDKVRRLMDLEEQMGVRSTFSFVPERYIVDRRLQEEIKQRGFGLSVHGLRHDGTLFSSYKTFCWQAERINGYMRSWGTTGFSAPSMLHRLEWMHHLGIDHSTATFDTDPFEPQPEGIGSVFPMWVKNNEQHKGFLELPYTLAQDFTVFIVLGEQTIDVWKNKIDWIAEKGGMALLNTHPDYMNFGDSKCGPEEYPAENYRTFLRYVKDRFGGGYWHVLANQIVPFWKTTMGTVASGPALPLTGKKKMKICMLAYTFYESDNRVRRYAEALAKRGDQVEAIAIRQPHQATNEVVSGVHVSRIQKRLINERGKFDYLYRITMFLFKSFVLLSVRHLRKPYDLIHVHSVPDFEVFAALVPKLLGARVVLDIHDIVPEFYAGKFNVGDSSFVVKSLIAVERICCAFSDHVIIANHLWYDKLVARSVNRRKCTPILNYPDQSIFKPASDKRENPAFVMMYPGTINRHQGLDVVVRALGRAKDKIGNLEFHIYGKGPDEPKIKDLSARLGLDHIIKFNGLLPLEQMAQRMAHADLGVVPKLANDFGNEAFSTKILEFMAMGVPVLVSRTKIDSYYFDDSTVEFFESGNEEDLIAKLLSLVAGAERRRVLIANGLRYVETNNWDFKKHEYLGLVDSLVLGTTGESSR